jgi:hypothetical protein
MGILKEMPQTRIYVVCTYIHTYITSCLFHHWGRQRSLPSTCYDPYAHLSPLPLSSDSSYTIACVRNLMKVCTIKSATYIVYIEKTQYHVHAHKCLYYAGIESATSCLVGEYSTYYAKSVVNLSPCIIKL